MNILITGATGLIGSRVIEMLTLNSRFTPIAAMRNQHTVFPKQVKTIKVDDLGPGNAWDKVLEDIEVIIHTAARVHVMSENAKDPLSEFRRVNVDGTLNLARQASNLGVKRFIFLSSIKVNGENTSLNHPFTEEDSPLPVDSYAISKFETEVGLFKLAEETDMEIVCIRPPLVYGPGVKANFLSMIRWVKRGVPLPFGAIHNKRSLVGLDNLVDLIITCIEHPAARNQIFLASDGEELSTTELLTRLSYALGKRPRLFSINQKLLELCLIILGRKSVVQRLCNSLEVDIQKSRKLLNWSPPFTIDEELRRTVEYIQ